MKTKNIYRSGILNCGHVEKWKESILSLMEYMILLIVVSFSILLFPFSIFAAELYVQSIKAPILSAPSLGSPKIAEASKGDVLKEVVKEENWYKVGYKDKTGWVSRLLVGSKPPSIKVSILEKTDEMVEKGARKRASAFTTAAAARGLAEDRARVSDKYRVDYAGIEWMEAIKISDEDVMKFLQKEGR